MADSEKAMIEVEPRLVEKIAPYLETTGWLRSAATKTSIDRNGDPLPWYTYASIHFLKGRLKREWRVFEFGSGNSTLWWAARTRHVTAVEHDLRWAERMKAVVPANVAYSHVPLETDGDYAKAAGATDERYDVIVVDGRDRNNCAIRSLPALTDTGVYVWDNSNRPRYDEGKDALMNAGFRVIDFRGHGPINGYETQTSFFYRADNCLGI